MEFIEIKITILTFQILLVLILILPFSNSKHWYRLTYKSYYKILCILVISVLLLADIISICVVDIPSNIKFTLILCHILLTGFIILLSLVINRLASLITEKTILDSKLQNIARSRNELKSLLNSAVEDIMIP